MRFLFIFLILLIGCKSIGKETSFNDINLDSIQVNKSYHMLNVETNPSHSLKMNFTFPTNYYDTDVLKKVERQFVSSYLGGEYVDLTPKEAISKYSDKFIDKYKSEENDFLYDQKNHLLNPDPSWYTYEEEFNNEIVYNQKDIISFVIKKRSNNGISYSYNIINQAIHLKTGNRINEKDIFIDDYKKELSKMIVEYIALMNNVERNDEIENIGFFSISEILPNQNFYINNEEIVYTYNECEIADSDLGAIVVRLPFEKMLHILKKESPIAHIAYK